ncbi:MAG TPA: DNA translocase FtsK [Bacteriovoracaceae bacterium]|nr:DNA translocase FtsK [Bacteriovoracaceae bacterium]
MEKKILRYQLYALFIFTTLNLVYFYYKESLPDNYYEISSQNTSINSFTYYLFSTLANFGFWCGIWVTVAFLVFAGLHSFVLTKKKDIKNQIVIAALLPLTLGLCFILLPETVGEGLYFLIRENLSAVTIVLSILFFGASFFYLVSEKQFFKTCKYLLRNFIVVKDQIKELNFSAFKNFDAKKSLSDLQLKAIDLLARFKKFESATVPSKLKIGGAEPVNTRTKESAKEKPLAKLKVPENKVSEFKLPELKISEPKNLENNDVLPADSEKTDDEEVTGELDEEINDSEIDGSDDTEAAEPGEDDSSEEDEETEASVDEDEFEAVESPYVRKKKVPDMFFDSEELISCIVPKNITNQQHDPDDQYFVKIAKAIEEKLKEFNITAHVINVLKGPVVDTFELELGAGVKVNGVTNRTDDLSLALMGAPIRMVYPMKGKSTIGLEVPRNPRDLIYLDEVLKSQTFKNTTYRLPIAMGKDAYGDAAVIDLASTPHFLVAGTTGAGKSVFVNTLLVSLIVKLSPRKLRLILIDPKQLELALYQTLPHLIMPVVTDHSIASVALLWAIDEMERRYTLLKDFGVKNIDGFNKKVKIAGHELLCKINKYYEDADAMDFEMPFIVIVVDEFGDLVLSKSGKAIENSISRLAAKARAAGIHIVLATQRPSTDVITGVIKANFPTRVAFRVTTNMDSRVILDTMGAEKLLGRGDMLFKQGIETLRMHSAFVEEDEIENLVKKLSSIPAQYDPGALEFIENNGEAADEIDGMLADGQVEGMKDDKYDEAVRVIAMHRVASASFLQRRLGVGYNRAANLIEEMERHGVVGPAQGSKPRKVLIPPPADSTP